SRATVNRAKLSLKAAGVPLRPRVVKTTSLRQTVGSLAGIVTLLALPLLALLAIFKLRDARGARRQLVASEEIGARLPSWGAPIATPLPVPSSGIHPTLA